MTSTYPKLTIIIVGFYRKEREGGGAPYSAENLQGPLESLDFCSPALGPHLVCLGLGDAHVFELLEILEHSIQLGLCGRPLRRGLRYGLVQLRSLLSLVLDRLLLRYLRFLIVLGRNLVIRLRTVLRGSDLGEALGEIGKAYLEHGNDAARRTVLSVMGLVFGCVVLLENLQGSLDACDAVLERLVLLREQIALLLAHLVHGR